jgi:heat shock protein HslJ
MLLNYGNNHLFIQVNHRNMKKNIFAGLLAFSVVIALTSCALFKKSTASAAEHGTNYNALVAHTWHLTTITGFDIENTAKPVSLSFIDSSGRVGGYGGCNGYGGEYTADESALKIEKVLSTMMACSIGTKTEQHYHTALRDIDHYKITGDKLELLKGKDVKLVFTAATN